MQLHLSNSIRSEFPSDISGDQFSFLPVPIVNGVPKLLYTDEEVATMFGFSVSTVRNRYNRKSKWYDPAFPIPRDTGGGAGRKSAVRWYWADLYSHARNLPQVPFGNTHFKPVRPLDARNYGSKAAASRNGAEATASTSGAPNAPFEL